MAAPQATAEIGITMTTEKDPARALLIREVALMEAAHKLPDSKGLEIVTLETGAPTLRIWTISNPL